MKTRRDRKRRANAKAEMQLAQEFAAQKLLDQNADAMGVLSKALANEPKALTKAFQKIHQKEVFK